MDSIIPYRGGKSKLTSTIIPLIPSDHHTYVEPFAGAAWVFFRKDPSKVEILNDINSDLVTLFRCVKYHLEEFARHLRFLLSAREEFERFRAMRPETMTDIQRSVRFFFLLRTGYLAQLNWSGFTISAERKSSFNLVRIEELLSAAHMRLNQVWIENRPYMDIISEFDKPSTFFYIDPPYWGTENDYGKGLFSKEDFGLLADRLAGIQGRFILSINDVPKIREIFSVFEMLPVSTIYSANTPGKPRPKARELLIANYPISKVRA